MKYKTKQKELIYNYFIKSKGDITAMELKEVFKGKIGLTTIYRCLQELEKDHIIHKYTNGLTHCATYEYIPHNATNHYHLQCLQCHTIIHLECSTFQEVASHIEHEHHFTMSPTKTTIYGLCEHCQK